MTNESTPAEPELVIQFDLKGLGALLRAMETAMGSGPARLALGSGVQARFGSSILSGPVIVKFKTPEDEGPAHVDPRLPATLELA
jgi:hypothetical protein